MNYSEAAVEFLSSLQRLGRQKNLKTIGNNMKGEMFALLLLHLAEKPISPGDLGSDMEISSARVAALLNSLEKKGQIVREIDKNDRRKILVRLTEKGEETALACRSCSIKHMALLMEKLGEEESRNMIRIIDKVTELMAEMPMTEYYLKEKNDVI